MIDHAWEEVPNTIEMMSGQPNAQQQIRDFWQAMIDDKSTLSPALGKAIQDELDHPPASILKGK